jgi:hypothetical protein
MRGKERRSSLGGGIVLAAKSGGVRVCERRIELLNNRIVGPENWNKIGDRARLYTKIACERQHFIALRDNENATSLVRNGVIVVDIDWQSIVVHTVVSEPRGGVHESSERQVGL